MVDASHGSVAQGVFDCTEAANDASPAEDSVLSWRIVTSSTGTRQVTLLCCRCGHEFACEDGIAASVHVAEAHGVFVEAPSAEPPAVGRSATIAPPQVTRTTYRCHQDDGSVVLQTRFTCSSPCGMEFDDEAQIEAHLSEIHGFTSVVAQPVSEEDVDTEATKITPTGFQVQRRWLEDGSVLMDCPKCGESFAEEACFLNHMSRMHGRVLAGTEVSIGTDEARLDMMHQGSRECWYEKRDEALRRLRVVSIGSFCGVKFSIQRLGLGQSHMPFDWIRTTCPGVIHFIRNGFRDFFSVSSCVDVPGTNLRAFRSARHSFWHDDIGQADVRRKLRRRIDRFLGLAECTHDLLFVRSCVSTEELGDVESLYEALCECFRSGDTKRRRVLLAVMIDNQTSFVGPIPHAAHSGIVFFGQPLCENASQPEGDAYCMALRSAMDAALSLPEDSDPSFGFGLCIDNVTNGAMLPVACGTELMESGGLRGPFTPCDMGLRSGFADVASFEELSSTSALGDFAANDLADETT
eukprot:TRINITY_DN19099_c0_g1_i1.p1 TRINITY_DN19099_c0_g1~~TRINITY_DN19099_c0_g1_i1.p1  ORF type:complete len:522 (-),score=90.02 TRINITY_DN19099_c0_g1_i1:60-1625(-)